MGYQPPREQDAYQSSGRRTLCGYALAALLSLVIMTVILRLWQADLRLPLFHRSDAAFTGMCIQGIIENGWYLTNPRLGAPGGLDLGDYPMADTLHFLSFKVLSLFSHNWAVVQNSYFLLTFPLTTLTALFVFRRFGCAYGPSLLGSMLFTFLPYHFLRGEIHLFLAAYYLVPLLIMLILEVFLDLPVFLSERPHHDQGPCLRWLRPVCRIVLCVMAASAGVYYTFFACFLLLVAGFSRWCRTRRFAPVGKSVALVALLGLATLLNLLPYVSHRLTHGRNPQSVAREPFHADVFGLKPVQLLLPVTHHRIALLKKLKARYNEAFHPLVNENDSASLGFVGSVGFALMLGGFLYRRQDARHAHVQNGLAILSLGCLFLCTVGGLGSLFSLLITPMIRGYNRVSVFIAFLALFTIVITVERLCAWASSAGTCKAGRQLLAVSLVPVLLVGGIWDQTTRTFVPPYSWVREEFTNDETFVRNIEAILPDGAMVFQLPYAWFPEQGQIHQMVDYDHLRGYLHSRRLRWSYGAYKGRPGDAWLKEVAAKPAEELVREISSAGFRGIYIDRSGFPDAGKELESKLTALLQASPLVSPNKNLAFFRLPDGNEPTYTQRPDDAVPLN